MRKLLLALALLPTFASAQTITGSIPNPTVVTTTGAVSVTGTVSETNLATLKVPANSMGLNGVVEIKCLWQYTNSANTKTLVQRFLATPGATSGGVTGTAVTATTTAAAQTYLIIRNNNATNAQLVWAPASTGPFGSAGSTPTSMSADTTVDNYVNVNGTLANSGETITLQHCVMTIFKS